MYNKYLIEELQRHDPYTPVVIESEHRTLKEFDIRASGGDVAILFPDDETDKDKIEELEQELSAVDKSISEIKGLADQLDIHMRSVGEEIQAQDCLRKIQGILNEY